MVSASSLQHKHRQPSIDYLRGLASLSVAWFHLTHGYHTDSLLYKSGALGYLGVEVFFVLSGFVIPLSIFRIGEKQNFAFHRFMIRRAIRVEIPFLASIGLFLLFWALTGAFVEDSRSIPSTSLETIILNGAYLVPFFDSYWLQPVYWTLAYEFAFYIIVGSTFFWFLPKESSMPQLAVLSALSMLVGFGLIPIYWLLFCLWAASFRNLFVTRSRKELGISCVLIGVAMVLQEGAAEYFAGLLTVYLVISTVGIEMKGVAGKILSGLGAISYSLYLTHILIGNRIVGFGLKRIGEDIEYQIPLTLFALFSSIAFAVLFYISIERPAHNLARKVSVHRA